MPAFGATEISPSRATAAKAIASAWSTAVPARPASPNARAPPWSRPDCPTPRPSTSSITSVKAAGHGPPAAWWGWTRTPSHVTSPRPVPTPDPFTRNWWLFPPTTREVQLDEKWGFVYQKEQSCDPLDPRDRSRGDDWDHTAVDPESRLLLCLVPGKRDGEV